MSQKWNWMGVFQSFIILVLQKFGQHMWQIKKIGNFLGEKPFYGFSICFIKKIHAYGMLTKKFISSKKWNKVAFKFKHKKKKDVANKRGGKKMQNKKQFIYFIVMDLAKSSRSSRSLPMWMELQGPNSVCQNLNLTKK
jgi:hypothetical protein